MAAGQGTVGLEMLAQQPAIDTLVVAVGGGGLIGGIAVAARAVGPASASSACRASASRRSGTRCTAARDRQAAATIADGIGVQLAGRADAADHPAQVDDVLLVDEGDIELAILALLEIEKTVVEGAGAVGLAALMQHRERFAGRRVGLVLCGGNIEPLVLAEIIERGMARSGRLVRLALDVRDVPGALAGVAALLGDSAPTSSRCGTSAPSATLSVERCGWRRCCTPRRRAHRGNPTALAAAGHRVERSADPGRTLNPRIRRSAAAPRGPAGAPVSPLQRDAPPCHSYRCASCSTMRPRTATAFRPSTSTTSNRCRP